MRNAFPYLLVLVLNCTIGCSNESDVANQVATGRSSVTMNDSIEIVDQYLTAWDEFAQGKNELVPHLRENKAKFEQALVSLLDSHDPRAASRLVFYPVVQVGGGIAVDSPLGKSAASLLGTDFPITTKKGDQVYFAGDLYFWWQKNKAAHQPFALFDEWEQRDFAQSVVIPMYQSTSKQ